MQAVSKRTGREITVAPDEWATMQQNGLARNFTLIKGVQKEKVKLPPVVEKFMGGDTNEQPKTRTRGKSKQNDVPEPIAVSDHPDVIEEPVEFNSDAPEQPNEQ